jgi:hypothetical protein
MQYNPGGFWIMRSFAYISIFTVFLLTTTPFAWSAVSLEGLLLYFNFDRDVGGSVRDESGGGHDGTLDSGAKIIKDNVKYGDGAIQIDGGNQAMIVESFKELEEYQENTFLFWINFTAPASGGWDQIIAKPAPGSDRSPGLWVTPEGLSIHWRYNPGNLGPWGITKSGNQNADFFEENVWYHVAGATKDGEIMCYVNGEEVHKDIVPGEFAQGEGTGNTGGLYVGNSPAYAGVAAKFILDELVVYTRALEQNEIQEIMEGDFTPVEARDKLTSTWGKIKHSN